MTGTCPESPMSTRPFFETAFSPIAGQTAVGGHDRQSVSHATDSCACGLASEGAAGDVYNEEAFRYFLDVERKRVAAPAESKTMWNLSRYEENPHPSLLPVGEGTAAPFGRGLR